MEEGDWPGWLLRGGFAPALVLSDPSDRALWLESYVRTYLERDLRSLSAVSSLPEFQRVMRLAANQCARVINQANLARDAALPSVTTHRYLNLLEAGGLLTRIPAVVRLDELEVVDHEELDVVLALQPAGVRGDAEHALRGRVVDEQLRRPQDPAHEPRVGLCGGLLASAGPEAWFA